MNKPIKEVQSLINDGVEAELDKFGFKYRKSLFEYVKKEKHIHYIYRINLLKMTEWFNVLPGVFIALPQVNKIYNQAFEREYTLSEPTFGFAIRNELRERGNYGIECDSHIIAVISKVIADFHEVAIPFFQKINSLKDVDLMANVNKDFGTPTVSSACNRLILAKLCDNPEYDKLANEYYNHCKQSQGILAEPILKVKSLLDNNVII
jgi:hypothetical protein